MTTNSNNHGDNRHRVNANNERHSNYDRNRDGQSNDNREGGARKRRPRVGERVSYSSGGGHQRPRTGDQQQRPRTGDRRYDNRRTDNRRYDDRRTSDRRYDDRRTDDRRYDDRRTDNRRYDDRRTDDRRSDDRRPYGGGQGGDRRHSNHYNRPRPSHHGEGGHRRPMRKPFKQVKYKEEADPDAPIRLNKYLSNAGVCSRREADEFIASGLVKVNGEVVDQLGTRITRADEVMVNDKVIELESKVYVLLNKPKGFVTTTDDPENRKTVMDLVRSACNERIYPVGRLDRGTTGVLLFTNDGDLASKLTHPRYEKRKIYQVWLDQPVAAEHMQAIADGIQLEDGEIHADAISYVTEEDLSQVGIEIHSGRNRIVRRIFEHLGYKVIKLDRVYFAGLTKKRLSRGKWRYLTPEEVNMLRMGAFD